MTASSCLFRRAPHGGFLVPLLYSLLAFGSSIPSAILRQELFAQQPPQTENRSPNQPQEVQPGAVLAWVRFPDAEESYAGVPYLWLGRVSVELQIDVPASPAHVLELIWGSKNDQRTAVVTVNDHQLPVAAGGYDGFRPLRVAMPDHLRGTGYRIQLERGAGKAAFLAEVRLIDTAAASGSVGGVPSPESTPAHRITYRTTVPRPPEAFPQMRPLWDTATRPTATAVDAEQESAFRQAEENARQAAEQFYRCHRFVEGWLAHADATTGLIPRNLTSSRDIWNAQDSAADNYPFMVLTCALVDRPKFEGRMLEMLHTETRLTSRLDRLPDTWSFSKQAFASEQPDLAAIIFGASEYVKDGLLPLTEWLGRSPWCDRMIGIVDDIWKHAPIETPYGLIPSENVEVNGEQLQALSRLYWLTGQEKYLDWAVRLGDYYLLGDHHPTRNFDRLRLRDHGCEIVSGLSELYVACHFARPDKKRAYREPVREMFDRILQIGRNPQGMLYNWIDPKTGEHDTRICDTWGYNYNGIYAVHLVDGVPAYREAVQHVLANLEEHLTEYDWGIADEYADSIEGALNLYNREPVPSAARWIESEIRDMWAKQQPDGVIEGWHGDGNVARTAIMYALWKTQGTWIDPWRADVRFGAVEHRGTLLVSLAAEKPWQGRLHFDKPRHEEQLHLPLDYPRINQFPQWFLARSDSQYSVLQLNSGTKAGYSGKQLQDGLPVELAPGVELRLAVHLVSGQSQ